MVPFRKLPPVEEVPPSSGPATLRSARFEAAAARPGFAPYDEDPSSDDDVLLLERSDIIPAVKPRQPLPLTDEELELQDEDLEILIDDEPILEIGEPDTERTVMIDDFDTEPPPPTLRCPGS